MRGGYSIQGQGMSKAQRAFAVLLINRLPKEIVGTMLELGFNGN